LVKVFKMIITISPEKFHDNLVLLRVKNEDFGRKEKRYPKRSLTF
jgi:hypothetical protein